jgi:hypothetical protein
MEEGIAAHLHELIEARDAVQWQIDMLAGGRPYYGTNRQLQIADVIKRLRSTLRDLEECLAAESRSNHPS